MNEVVTIGEQKLLIIEWNGERVITSSQLADVYETSTDNIKKNFRNNKEHFIEGKHFYLIKGDELKELKSKVTDFPLVGKFANQLYLWTRQGASRHCKMLGTDKAWEQFDILEENYYMPSHSSAPTGKELLALAVLEAQKVIEEKNKIIEVMTPKAEFHDRVAASDDTITFDQMAKILKSHGIEEIGRNRLFADLRASGVLMLNNVPYQKFMEKGYFKVKETTYTDNKLQSHIRTQTFITPKGQEWIVKNYHEWWAQKQEEKEINKEVEKTVKDESEEK